MKRRRQIVQIDEEKCNGCGLCITACAEGALQLIDGKAKLVKDIYCDGLGACLGDCPEDAIKIIEREADDFDQAAVDQHLAKTQHTAPQAPAHEGCGCPGTATKSFAPATPSKSQGGGCPGSALRSFNKSADTADASQTQAPQQSQLGQWPVQLKLVPPFAPYLQGADLLICADCVPFAVPDFHGRYLKGRALLVGCPKLDDLSFYRDKLEDVFQTAKPKSITVLKMEVPCCTGLAHVAVEARDAAGLQIPLTVETIGIQGGNQVEQFEPQQASTNE